MKKNISIQITALVLFMMIPMFLLAQPGFDDDVSDVPVDGGLSLLVAAGIGYGVKRIKSMQKNK